MGAQKTSPSTNTYIIKNAHTLSIGKFATVNSSTGRVENGGTGSSQYPVGMVKAAADGVNFLGNTAGTVSGVVESGFCVKYAVTGASAATDIGTLVYIYDSATLTTSQPSGSLPCGIIIQHVTGSTCMVYLFTVPEMFVYKYTA